MLPEDSVEEAFLKVDLLVRRILEGDGEARNPAFREIFRLNNEIGKRARAKPSLMASLRALQAQVNAITVEIKSGNNGQVKEALENVRKSVGDLKNRLRECRHRTVE